jgi:hypothetical protein
MASRVRSGGRPVTLATKVPGGTARRHSPRCRLRPTSYPSSTFLRSLRSMAITPLLRYYGRSDSCPPDSETLRCRACSTGGQVSLIHVLGLPTVPSPTTCGGFVSPRHVTCRRIGPRGHPTTGYFPQENSGLRHCTAGSPPHAGRIEFVSLRTGRSPPAALHPVLPRRSCSRLQVTSSWRGLSPLRPSALSGAQCGGLTPPSPLGLYPAGTLRRRQAAALQGASRILT